MTTILNRDFQHPLDGWYMIEPKGEHRNAAANVIQVIDELAAEAIVNHFHEQASAPNFPGMLVDHEHFSHDTDKETRAFGWLTGLENRPSGIFGQIRWTASGKAAVDGGDYRFFSTEYLPAESEILNSTGPKQIRPLRLAGLTLTNRPNNKGGEPITNSANGEQRMANGEEETDELNRKGRSPVASRYSREAAEAAVLNAAKHSPYMNPDGTFKGGFDGCVLHMMNVEGHDKESATKICGYIAQHVKNRDSFNGDSLNGGSSAPAQLTNHDLTSHNKPPMTKLTTKLGLAAEASEDAILEAVSAIMNRATEAEKALDPLKKQVTDLQAENKSLKDAQVETDLARYENRIPAAQKDFIKGLLLTNREATIKYLESLPQPVKSGVVCNRATAKTPADAAVDPGEAVRAAVDDYRIKNRCTFQEAWNAVQREKPELFKTENQTV